MAVASARRRPEGLRSCRPQDMNFKRPWSTSYDTALPMLKSRSVTGWPHHLTCRAPTVQGGLQNHSCLGQHQGGMLLRRAVRGCGRQGMHLLCKQRHAGALPAISIFFCARVPKPKQSRRMVVNHVTSGCKSRRNRVRDWKCYFKYYCRAQHRARGRHESARLGTARHPGKHRGARPLSSL